MIILSRRMVATEQKNRHSQLGNYIHKKCNKEQKLTIFPRQSRAGRALIGWSREALAEASLVGLRTIIDFERGARNPQPRTLLDLRRALEEGGVIFLEEDDVGGPGVRLALGRRASIGPD